MTATFVTTGDGLRLEAAWDVPDDTRLVAVLCHPHPLHGGSMAAPLIRAVARVLVRSGVAVLRFNFRGVGGSEGSWGGGRDEIADVAAAVETARRDFLDVPLGISGWSFGAVAALRWSALTGTGLPYVGIAPPVRSDLSPGLPGPGELVAGPRRFVVGNRDQFVTVEELTAYADSIAADVAVIPGSDHFFHFRDQRVGHLVAEGLGAVPPSAPPENVA